MQQPEFSQWRVSNLLAHCRTSTGSARSVQQMVAMIREFGFRMPIIIQSNGDIVDGYVRLKAASLLGLETVPVILVEELTPAQVKAFSREPLDNLGSV